MLTQGLEGSLDLNKNIIYLGGSGQAELQNWVEISALQKWQEFQALRKVDIFVSRGTS